MGVRYRRTGYIEDNAERLLAQLAYPGRSLAIGNGRVRRLLEAGEELGLTAGDTVRVATVMLQALDEYEEFHPAIEELMDSFDSGTLTTDFREPLHLYVEREAVAALAVAACAECRPKVPVREGAKTPVVPGDPFAEPVIGSPVVVDLRQPDEVRNIRFEEPMDQPLDRPLEDEEFGSIADWPGETEDGDPQIALDVKVWWPGLEAWEEARITAVVSEAGDLSGDGFALYIEQEGDEKPTRATAVWLVARRDLKLGLPVFELRAASWRPGDEEPNRYRFLFASSSLWAEELHDYLAARWVSHGSSPEGPEEFDEPFGERPPAMEIAAAS